MRAAVKTCVVALCFAAFASLYAAVEPVWRIDVATLRAQRPRDEITVKFSGRYLVVFSGSLSIVGGQTVTDMHPSLVWDTEKGDLVPQDRSAALSLVPREECTRNDPATASVIVACRKQMSIERTGDNSPGHIEPIDYYLREPGKQRVLLDHSPPRCLPGEPVFVSDDLILLSRCRGPDVVVNKQGQKIYEAPKFAFPYIVASLDGSRFVVYERDISFLSSLTLGHTTNRLRVKVFRSADGKKLFDYRWHIGDQDSINDGQVALSDNGSLVALVRDLKVLVFAVHE